MAEGAPDHPSSLNKIRIWSETELAVWARDFQVFRIVQTGQRNYDNNNKNNESYDYLGRPALLLIVHYDFLAHYPYIFFCEHDVSE